MFKNNKILLIHCNNWLQNNGGINYPVIRHYNKKENKSIKIIPTFIIAKGENIHVPSGKNNQLVN